MNYVETTWNGFRCLEFVFQDRKARLVCPNEKCLGNKWLLKTEYFGAFPEFEIDMLNRGYHVAYVANVTRWHDESDDEIKERFCEFLHQEFQLHEACMTVGMSCGGMHAIYFAAKYPKRVAAMYLDAPVCNLLSCPAGVGVGGNDLYPEFLRHKGMTISELINYRNHPIDHIEKISQNHIPVFLVVGDVDDVVPYVENGKLLYDYLQERGETITQVIKEGCGHHPHGLKDNTALIEFAMKYY